MKNKLGYIKNIILYLHIIKHLKIYTMSNANFQNRIIASQVMIGSTYVITSVTGTYTSYYTIESITLTKAKRYVFTYSLNQKNNLTGKDFIQQSKSTAVVGHKEVFDYIVNN